MYTIMLSKNFKKCFVLTFKICAFNITIIFKHKIQKVKHKKNHTCKSYAGYGGQSYYRGHGLK